MHAEIEFEQKCDIEIIIYELTDIYSNNHLICSYMIQPLQTDNVREIGGGRRKEV